MKTRTDDRHCRGETSYRQNKLWQFIANIMIHVPVYVHVYKSCSRIKVLLNYNIMINYESLVGN